MSEKGTQERDVPKNYFFLTFWFEIIQTLWVFFILLTYLLFIMQRMKQKYGFEEYGTEFWLESIQKWFKCCIFQSLLHRHLSYESFNFGQKISNFSLNSQEVQSLFG